MLFLRLLILFMFFVPIVLSAQQRGDSSVQIRDQQVVYETPMGYELMHIAMALTDTTITTNGYNLYREIIDTSSTYYRGVMQYFGPHKDHELIKALNKGLAKSASNYIYNLHRGYESVFTTGELRELNIFPMMHRLAYSSGAVNLKLVNSFAAATGFSKFYQDHVPYYQDLLNKSKENSDVASQQLWLEQQFPARYQQYNIVISPLMHGTHFTKRFDKDGESKCIMWVAGFEGSTSATANINRGQYIGVVMTEIDHNYVNPVSERYERKLDALMGGENRANWTNGEYSNAYKSGFKVFNEYMTHATYLIYTAQKFTAAEQTNIENARIIRMEQIRKFSRFGDFYRRLRQLFDAKKSSETIADLYPAMMEWCAQQNVK